MEEISREEINHQIGAFLRNHREAKSWSRGQLCRKIGCSANELFCYESGRRSLTLINFIKFCRILEITNRHPTQPLSAEEQFWLEAYRNRDYGVIIDWLRNEIAGEK